MAMHKAKVLVVGPCESGKSTIANFLSDSTESSGGGYRPTAGCRILEFEVNNVEVGSRTVNTEVELWDISGDHKYEACWPAIARDTNGVVFVYNPDHPNHDKDLESWHKYFVEQSNVKESQCVAFAHNKSGTTEEKPPTPPAGSAFSKVLCVNTSIEDSGDQLRDEFNSFLSRLLTSMSDKREQEELSIMNSR